jgi:hypothetical protein
MCLVYPVFGRNTYFNGLYYYITHIYRNKYKNSIVVANIDRIPRRVIDPTSIQAMPLNPISHGRLSIANDLYAIGSSQSDLL